MHVHHLVFVTLALASVDWTACAQQTAAAADPPLTAKSIMARVAVNQDQAESERGHYIYLQHAVIRSRNKSTLMCEEITDSRVTPSPTGSHQQLLKLNGKVLQKGKYFAYTALPALKNQAKDQNETGSGAISIELGNDDRNLVQVMRGNLTNDKSRDGMAARLFPLTSKSQTGYSFQLIGRRRVNGRDVFHIAFHPTKKDEFGWKGDAYIDAAAYQPVVVSTTMARKVPFAARTLLGFSLPGLGFSVTYEPLPDGVWFPVSFGTEFKINVLFFFSREFAIDLKNREFQKTNVDSKIVDSENLQLK